jgi:Ricin-type beta-trefoil lectin domain/Subtilase family
VRKVMLSRRAVAVAAAGALGALSLSAWAGAAVAAPHAVVANGHSAVARPASLATRAPATLTHGSTKPVLPAGEHYVCPPPTQPGEMTCMSIVQLGTSGTTAPAASGARRIRGYGPTQLRSAYKLGTASAQRGHGATIAIVDAYSDPHAAADLAVYRAHFHLPRCATTTGCLRIVNEHGKPGPLPAANWDWAAEESLDLDMVSAVCPNCRILLIEATNPSTRNLGTAEQTAISKGARFVSNSWNGQEFTGQDFFDRDFNHPGVAIDFASGDIDYGPGYPSDLQYVTSVGGTSLHKAAGKRGWSEKVWGPGSTFNREGTGSGCSALEAKPSWQHADDTSPDGCLNRTENDVSADANPATGVAMYDTWNSNGNWPKGWNEFGGTSAATPIITGIYALAGAPAKGTYPAEYPYLNRGSLFDVKSGSNGRCESFRQYLCNARPGYDGPTGLGTPDGTAAFSDHGAHRVTVTDPGTQDVATGAAVSVKLTGLDTRKVTGLHYSVAGLNGSGLSISAVPHSTDARITGTAGSPGTFHVVVTARDGATSGTTHFSIVIAASLTPATSVAPSVVRLKNGSSCLDGGPGTPTAGNTVAIRACSGASASQQWNYLSDGKPDDTGTLTVGGLCLGLSATRGVLATCSPGARSQKWEYLGAGLLGSISTGKCLDVPGTGSGTAVRVAACTGSGLQGWRLPAGPLVSALTSLCLDNPGDTSFSSTKVKAATCAASAEQNWALRPDGSITSSTGLCLSGKESLLSGSAVVISFCDSSSSSPDFSQLWIPGPGGELINEESGRCLADPGNAGAGTVLRQEDCYGEAGEIWSLN